MVKISLVNMYLHKFTNPKINEYDTLSSEDRWNEYYDVILANPPFFSPKGGITPHNRFGVKSTKAEVLFVDYINEHLKPNGRAGIIIPEGIVFQTGTAYKQLRKKLIDTSLIAVISLPAGVFFPYSGVKTSILILDKNKNKKDNFINFININNDGYSLDVKRSVIKGDQLPSAIDEFKNNSFNNKIEKSKILNDQNISLVFANYEENNFSKKIYDQVLLKDLVDIKNGYAFKSSDYVEKSNVFNFRMSQIRPNGIIDLEHNPKFLPENFYKKYDDFIINEGDVVIAMTDMASDPKILGVPAIIPKTSFKLLLNQRVGKFIDIDEKIILKKYLCYVLKSKHLREYYKNLSTGGLQLNLNKQNILKIKVPLPSLDIQNDIVNELDSYEKIIDGCKKVKENYKPSIDIDTSWDLVELGKICNNFMNGLNFSAENVGSGNKIINVKSLFNYYGYIDDNNLERVDVNDKSIISKKVNEGDILFVRSSVKYEGVGYPCIAKKYNENLSFAGFIIKATPDKNKVIPEFLCSLLRTSRFRNITIKKSNRGTITNISQNNLMSIKVPLPNLEIQKKIVKDIFNEYEIIRKNDHLIDIFEDKIENTIKSLWIN